MLQNMPQVYFDKSGTAIPHKSVIVFADILGYSNRIEEASKNGKLAEAVNIFHRVISRVIGQISDLTKEYWYVKAMTDNIVAAFPIPEDSSGFNELEQACSLVGKLQLDLIKWNFPIRGGIAVGAIHISENLYIPSSQVLVESKNVDAISHWPRIVLLDSTREVISDSRIFPESKIWECDDLLWKDSDGLSYVNYMRPLVFEHLDDKKSSIRTLKSMILGRLKDYEHQQRIRSKYVWMALYHNRFCRSEPGLCKEAEYLIQEEDIFQARP